MNMNRSYGKTILLLTCLTTLPSFLMGCSSSSDSAAPTNKTITPVHVSAGSDHMPTGAFRQIDTSSLHALPGRNAFSIVGIATGEEISRVNLIHWPPPDSTGSVGPNFYSYDIGNDTFTPLFSVPALLSPAIAQDGSAGVYLDGCDAYFHRFESTSDALLINPFLQEFACPRPMTLSVHADTVSIYTARGELNDEGRLVYAGDEMNKYSHVAYRPADGSVLDMSRDALPVGDPDLDRLQRTMTLQQMSEDGRQLLYTVYFLPIDESEQRYVVGTLLVDIDSSRIRLLNKNIYTGPICTRCGLGGQDDSVLSGNGQVVYYLQSVGSSTLQDQSLSELVRFEIETGDSQTIELDQSQRSALVTNHDGSRVAFLNGDSVLVYDSDTETVLNLDEAMLFCNGVDCLFESYRFVRNDPLRFSANGNALLINVIPEKPALDTPQNTQELLYLDVQSRTLSRVAPNADTLFFAISEDGLTVSFVSETPNLVNGDTDYTEDLFIVAR